MPRRADRDEQIVLGRLGKPHGVKGWIRLNSFTNPPENILHYDVLRVEHDGAWRDLQIDDSRTQQKGLLVHIIGFDSPETVAELNGCELGVAASALPELDRGEYYWHQLLGLQVINLKDEVLGVVERLLETGANDVLLVTPNQQSIDDRERLIPFVRDRVIREVDLDKQLIRIDWDADFLE